MSKIKSSSLTTFLPSGEGLGEMFCDESGDVKGLSGVFFHGKILFDEGNRGNLYEIISSAAGSEGELHAHPFVRKAGRQGISSLIDVVEKCLISISSCNYSLLISALSNELVAPICLYEMLYEGNEELQLSGQSEGTIYCSRELVIDLQRNANNYCVAFLHTLRHGGKRNEMIKSLHLTLRMIARSLENARSPHAHQFRYDINHVFTTKRLDEVLSEFSNNMYKRKFSWMWRSTEDAIFVAAKMALITNTKVKVIHHQHDHFTADSFNRALSGSGFATVENIFSPAPSIELAQSKSHPELQLIDCILYLVQRVLRNKETGYNRERILDLLTNTAGEHLLFRNLLIGIWDSKSFTHIPIPDRLNLNTGQVVYGR